MAGPAPVAHWRCGHPKTPENTINKQCRFCRKVYMMNYNAEQWSTRPKKLTLGQKIAQGLL